MTRFPMWRYPLFLLLSSVLLAASVKAEPVKLAVLLPLSNIYKEPGIDGKRGLLLGIQEEAALHKVPWKSWISLEFHDTRTDPDHSLQLAKDAITGGAKAILGPAVSSKVALKMRDYVLDEAGVPLIVFPGSASSKLRTKHPLFIRIGRSVPLLSTGLAQWLIDNPIVSSRKPQWACIHADYGYGVGVCDGFKRAYEDKGEEVGRIPVPLKTLNKKKEIVQLTKLTPKPDFALAVFVGAEAEVFFRDYYRFKVHEKIPVLALFTAVTPGRLRSYEKTLDKYGTAVGLVTATAYLASIDNPANHEFVAQYQKAYNGSPSVASMWGYDTGRLLVKALVRLQGKWDGAKVVHLMKTLSYTSPRHGEPLQFDTHNDVIQGALIQKTIRKGNQLVNEIIGQSPPINMDELLK